MVRAVLCAEYSSQWDRYMSTNMRSSGTSQHSYGGTGYGYSSSWLAGSMCARGWRGSHVCAASSFTMDDVEAWYRVA